jgi:hypothetical protein
VRAAVRPTPMLRREPCRRPLPPLPPSQPHGSIPAALEPRRQGAVPSLPRSCRQQVRRCCRSAATSATRGCTAAASASGVRPRTATSAAGAAGRARRSRCALCPSACAWQAQPLWRCRLPCLPPFGALPQPPSPAAPPPGATLASEHPGLEAGRCPLARCHPPPSCQAHSSRHPSGSRRLPAAPLQRPAMGPPRAHSSNPRLDGRSCAAGGQRLRRHAGGGARAYQAAVAGGDPAAPAPRGAEAAGV